MWRDKGKRTLLAVPKAARGDKVDGDTISVAIEFLFF